MRNTRFVICLIFLFPLFFAPAILAAESAETGVGVGMPAPLFELRDLADTTVSLASLRGKIVLLNFWSARCRPCTDELPSLSRLAETFAADGLRVLAVNIDASDRLVHDFLREQAFFFTILRDDEQEVYFDLYAGPGLPASYLIDRNGMIADRFPGPQTWDSPAMIRKFRLLLRELQGGAK